jgi:adenylate kinase family enzyme
LSEKLNFAYIETSKIGELKIRNAKKNEYLEVEGKKYFYEEEKKLWESGKLWDPPFVTAFMKEEFQRLFEEGKSLLLAGSPRTLYEGEQEIPFLERLYGKEHIRVVLIELSEAQSLYRNSHRRICELMRHPILFNEETKHLGACPLDGSKLLRREGLDDPETIKVRLREYVERTFPLVEYFTNYGLRVSKVNGDQSVAQVFGAILETLK